LNTTFSRFPLALTVLLPVAARAAEPTLQLAEVLAEVRAKHPALVATRTAAQAADARTAQARAWDDPGVAFKVMRNDTLRLTTFDRTELEVRQSVPLSGRLQAREAAARAEAAIVRSDLGVREVDLLAEARRTYYQLAIAEAQLALVPPNRRLLEALRDDLRAKYAAGLRPLADSLATEVEITLLDERLLELTGQRAAARARLNALMQRPLTDPLPAAPLPALPGDTPGLENYVAAARIHNPLLTAAARRTASAQSRIELTRYNGLPDPEVMVAARKINASGRLLDEYDTAVALRLPWANRGRYRAERLEARLLADAAAQERAAAEAEVLARVAGRWHLLAALRDCCSVYRDTVLPLARRNLAATRIAYEAGQVPFSDLLEAHRKLLDVEAGVVTRTGDYFLGLAELDQATGVIPAVPPSPPQ
jgi:outer membrane protein TolC